MPDGERTNGTAATEHTAAGAEGQAERRREQGGARQQTGSRERSGRQKKRYDIYLRERREKNAAETRKSIQVCVYTYHLIPWRVGCLFHFLLYILRGYIIYIYIYYITPINVYFSFKVNVYLDNTLLYV